MEHKPVKNIPEANTPAIYRPITRGVFRGQRVGKMWMIKQTNSPYSVNGLAMRASTTEPIYGYVKNYTKYKKDYSLFVWTTEKDIEKVEKFLDGIKVDRVDIVEVLNKVRAFKYLDVRLV